MTDIQSIRGSCPDSVRGFKMRPDTARWLLWGHVSQLIYKLGSLMIIACISQLLDMTVLDIICILCVVCRLVASENLKVQRNHVLFTMCKGTGHRWHRRDAQRVWPQQNIMLAFASKCQACPGRNLWDSWNSTNNYMERSTILNGKSHYFNGHVQQLC